MISKNSKKRIEFSPLFKNKLEKVPLEIKIAFRESLETFLENHHHISLRNHVLTKEFAGIRSIDVTGDWRALYREEGKRIIFVELGTHEDLYT
jgi:addiction module RelE/StbE family toxin